MTAVALAASPVAATNAPSAATLACADGRDSAQAGHTVWQVKASMLCNLRCRYCYEWDRLGDRARMTLVQWERVFVAARAYRDIRLRRHGVAATPVMMWHGGEPLLLSSDYVRDVLALQRQVFVAPGEPNVEVVHAVQTNLRQMNKTLNVMIAAGFQFSVSLDFAPGARVDANGRDTDEAVRANLRRLATAVASCGVIVVLGRHNATRLIELNDWLEALDIGWMRIVPMLDAPAAAPGGLRLGNEEVVTALSELLVHRLQRAGRMRVHPLEDLIQAVIRRRAGIAAPSQDRRCWGESRLVVHPDGTLTAQGGTAAPHVILGNVFEQDAEEIFGSAAYASSLDHDDALRARHCSGCAYRAVCTGRPVRTHAEALPDGPCPVDSQLMAALDAHLDGVGGAQDARCRESATSPAPRRCVHAVP